MLHAPPLVSTIAIGLVLAFSLGVVAHRLKLPPLIGYLVAGIAVGPFTPGVVAGDLGEAEVADLAPQFQEAANKLQVGEVSDPIRTGAGLHLIAVCGRRTAGGQMADKEQIERRLRGQQLSMIARRYMRDLRNSATIETK